MTTNFKGGEVLIVPQEYADPYAYETDHSIEQSVLPAHERAQFDLTRDDEINGAVFDEMNADQQRRMLLKEVQSTYYQDFEGPRAMSREAISPEADVAGIVSVTSSLMNRRALELGLANNAPIMPYVNTAANKPEPSVNTYKYQQPNENVISRSTEDPQTNYELAA